MTHRQVFHGLKRRLVMGIDLGTTYSGISYAILDPGKIPEIHTISRYPGQDAGDSKVQTVIWYDVDGKVLAAGAEEPPYDDEDDDEGEDGPDRAAPIKTEWFKLLLRPKHTTTTVEDIQPCKIPASKSIVDVYADFYRYLFEHARAYIQQTHASGHLLWESFKEDIDIVLSHPNGWEGAEQSAMRQAAMAGLVPDTFLGRERVTFVPEGEASLHYCLASGLIAEEVKRGNNIIIIDAGGGTVDLSTYTFVDTAPPKGQEIARPGCIFEGSDFVRRRAIRHLTGLFSFTVHGLRTHSHIIIEKLRNSSFGTEASLNSIAHQFDQTAKKRFKGAGDSSVKFGNVGDNDRDVQIRNGRIKLTEEEVRGYFDPGIKEIIRAIEAQQDAVAPDNISAYLLVGGFAASEYLYNEIDAHLKGRGSRLFRPDPHAGKAVAVGAVSFHIDHFVSTRVAKLTYGTSCTRPYQRSIPSHRSRCRTIVVKGNGRPYVPGGFLTTIQQGTQVSETTLFKTSLIWTGRLNSGDTLSSRLFCYRGSLAPEWMDEDPDKFSTLCTITADISAIPKQIQQGSQGSYWQQEFFVVLAFGLTELKAHLSWIENGVEMSGPASIVYDDNHAIPVSGRDR
ncbi:hypothetical protein OF83DRAFT_1117634 [Amylostereum chailletii]|nr:hypothetical protein OF83DRAFT_1117634 [Amylostereum chailletii]